MHLNSTTLSKLALAKGGGGEGGGVRNIITNLVDIDHRFQGDEQELQIQ